MAQEIKHGNIELDIINNNKNIYICKLRRNFRNGNPRSISNHISHKHKKCPVGRMRCPYCPATFGRMSELKRHFRRNNCKTKNNKTGTEIWDEINNINNEPNANERI